MHAHLYSIQPPWFVFFFLLIFSPVWISNSYLFYQCIYRSWRASILSPVQPFGTPWSVACQSPPSMEFSRQEYWSRLPFLTPGDVPHLGIKSTSLSPPALSGRFFILPLSHIVHESLVKGDRTHIEILLLSQANGLSWKELTECPLCPAWCVTRGRERHVAWSTFIQALPSLWFVWSSTMVFFCRDILSCYISILTRSFPFAYFPLKHSMTYIFSEPIFCMFPDIPLP